MFDWFERSPEQLAAGEPPSEPAADVIWLEACCGMAMGEMIESGAG